MNSLRFFPLLILALIGPNWLYGQLDTMVTYGAGEIVNEKIGQLQGDIIAVYDQSDAELDTLRGINMSDPFWRYMYFFDDAEYYMNVTDKYKLHRFVYKGTHRVAKEERETYALATAVYSGGERPRTRKKVGFVKAGKSTPDTTELIQRVDSGQYLKIAINDEVLPGEPNILVINVENVLTNRSLSGQLIFLYNSAIKDREIDDDESKNEGKYRSDYAKMDLTKKYEFSEAVLDNYVKYDNITLPDTLKGEIGDYKKAIVFEIDSMPSASRTNIFLEMLTDSTIHKFFGKTRPSKLSFHAFLFVSNNQHVAADHSVKNNQADYSAEFYEMLNQSTNSQNISNINNQSVELYAKQYNDFSLEPLENAKLISVYSREVDLVKSYDPNELLITACACNEEDEDEKVIFNVRCENGGGTYTSKVFIDIPLAAGINPKSIADQPIKIHPDIPGLNIEKEIVNGNTLRWKLMNLALQSTQKYGVGDPSTYAELTFTALLDDGVDPFNLEPMQACIRFDGLSEDSVCTPEVSVVKLESADEPIVKSLMSCSTACISPPFDAMDWLMGLPIWILLIILLLLILLFIYLRNRSIS